MQRRHPDSPERMIGQSPSLTCVDGPLDYRLCSKEHGSVLLHTQPPCCLAPVPLLHSHIPSLLPPNSCLLLLADFCATSDPCKRPACQWSGNKAFFPTTCSPFPACFFAGAKCKYSNTCPPPPPPPSPPPPAYIKSVLSFGAKGDGVANDTSAMSAAFAAACSLAAEGGPAVMLLPAGYVFRLAAPVVWKGPCGTNESGTLTIQVGG